MQPHVSATQRRLYEFLNEKVHVQVIDQPIPPHELHDWAEDRIEHYAEACVKKGKLKAALIFLVRNPDNEKQTLECIADLSSILKDPKTKEVVSQFLPQFLQSMGAVASIYVDIFQGKCLNDQEDFKEGDDVRVLMFSVETTSTHTVFGFLEIPEEKGFSLMHLFKNDKFREEAPETSELFYLLVPRVNRAEGVN